MSTKSSKNIFFQLRNRETKVLKSSRNEFRIPVYKLFHKFSQPLTTLKEFKCIFKDFFANQGFAFFEDRNLSYHFKSNLKQIKYYKKDKENPIIINVIKKHANKLKNLNNLISYINKKINNEDEEYDDEEYDDEEYDDEEYDDEEYDDEEYDNVYKKLNSFYISQDKETLYIIDDDYLYLEMFKIENKEILNLLDELPIISEKTGNITLIRNIESLKHCKESKDKSDTENEDKSNTESEDKSNTECDDYMHRQKITLIFEFNKSDIKFTKLQKLIPYTLHGNKKDWYYIKYMGDYLQLVHITPEDIDYLNGVFSSYNTSFKIDIKQYGGGRNIKSRRLLKIY